MEPIITAIVYFSGLMVPMLAMWAVVALYTQRPGAACCTTQCLFFGALLLIAGITLRTVAADDGCWLVHTASLGVMIVAGVMRRPAGEEIPHIASPAFGTQLNSW